MEIRPGLKLRSAVSEAEFIVIRGAGDVDLRCGAAPVLTDPAQAVHVQDVPGEVLLGKRYSDESGSLEIMCVKGGAGSLSVGDQDLDVKAARALPSSD